MHLGGANLSIWVSVAAIAAASSRAATPHLTSVNPTQGPIGTTVTVTGFGFTPEGNNITLSGVPYSVVGVPSATGTMITFQIPPVLCNQLSGRAGACPPLQPGTYTIVITNSANQRMEGAPAPLVFTVTQQS